MKFKKLDWWGGGGGGGGRGGKGGGGGGRGVGVRDFMFNTLRIKVILSIMDWV